MPSETTHHEADGVKHHQIAWLVLQCRTREPISLVVATSVVRTPHDSESRNDRERIQVASGVRLAQCLAESAFHRQLQRIPNASRRIVRIEFDGAYEMM